VPPRLDCDEPLGFDASGAPISERYRDIYRSRAGAWSEAQQVFITGCELGERWSTEASGVQRFCILELGFGLGVNFLATCALYCSSGTRPHRLNYVAIEAHPVHRDDLIKAHQVLGLDGGEVASLARELQEAWPVRTPGLHRLSLDGGRIGLVLAYGDVVHLLPRLNVAADAIFLDGFSPSRNPAMWQPDVMSQLARLSRPAARLASYSVARSVCDGLTAAGFEVRIEKGYGTKRQRLVATYAPRWRSYPPPPPCPRWPDQRAIVIGAGLAGSAIAHRLYEQAWAVTLVDAHSQAGSGGSAQPWCADHVHVSPDDNLLARATRAALFIATSARQRLAGQEDGSAAAKPSFLNASGRLMLADDSESELHQQALLARLGMPNEFVSFLDSEEASQLAGVRLSRGGLWFAQAGAIAPKHLIARRLAPLTEQGSLRLGCRISAIHHDGDLWHVADQEGQRVAQAPVLVLAAAPASLRLAGMSSVDIRQVRGQTTWVRYPPLDGLRVSLGGAAYVVPDSGRALVGASYDQGDLSEPSVDSDISNLRRLARLFQVADLSAGCQWHSAAVGFRYATVDRMPLIGAVPDEENIKNHAATFSRNARLPLPRRPALFMASALGSRGALWSELAAEVILAQLLGDPAPIESDLLAAIDPARSLRQALRRSGNR
jgi:tRNA 5-methylaminomethyl-2-thiouridine biosynthesis bifunctional protein